MKKLFLIFTLLGLSCSSTTLLAAATVTVIQPSATQPAPTATTQPTATMQPTATPPPTATPLPPAISAQNAAQIENLGEMNAASLRKVVFSPDGKIFATSSGNETDFGIKTWQSQGQALLHSFEGFSGIVWDLAFSPDGQWIASAADDQNGQRVRIWNAADGRQIIALDGPATASSVAFSPDGTRLAVGGLVGWPQGVIWIFDTSTWKMVQLMTAPGQNVTAVVFSRDGSQLYSSGTDGRIRLWSMSNGTEENVISSGKQANRLALSPSGSLLASSFCDKTDNSGCTQGGITIWRTSDWKIMQKFEDLAESLAFSADSSLLISGSGPNDRLIRIRRIEDWSVVHTLPGEAFSVAISPDNRMLVSTRWDKILIWGLPRN